MYILAEKELIKFWKYITTALVCFECVRVGHYTRTVLTSTQNASTVFGHWQLQRQVTVFFVCCVQICLLTSVSLKFGTYCALWICRGCEVFSSCLVIVLAVMVGGLSLWPALRYGTGYQAVWEIQPSAENPSSVHWRRFYFYLTSVHSALELFGWCALQIYLLTCGTVEFVGWHIKSLVIKA